MANLNDKFYPSRTCGGEMDSLKEEMKAKLWCDVQFCTCHSHVTLGRNFISLIQKHLIMKWEPECAQWSLNNDKWLCNFLWPRYFLCYGLFNHSLNSYQLFLNYGSSNLWRKFVFRITFALFKVYRIFKQ